MLKISEMAKLANTTRRTLIYYDEQDLFKPKEKNAAGYRFYDYNQLYDLLFILSLRNLGITLNEIKQIIHQPNNLSLKQLKRIEERLKVEEDNIHHSRKVIANMIHSSHDRPVIKLLCPMVTSLPETYFWCSRQSASCTDAEVAEMFAEFYQELGSLAVINECQSGYLTTLDLNNSAGYADAAFRVIKEVQISYELSSEQSIFPMVKRPAGRYLRICVLNSSEDVQAGLDKLAGFCKQHHYHTDNHLWQINCSNRLDKKGASQKMLLEYRLSDSQKE